MSHSPKKDTPVLDFVSYMIAFAILTPIGWWLKENHFIANWIRATFYH